MFRIQLKRCLSLLGVAAALIIPSSISTAAQLPEETVYTYYYLPDAIEFAGNIYVYLKNPTQKPLIIAGISMDGKPIGKIWRTDQSFLAPEVREEYIKVTDDRVWWYRVYPNPTPVGGVTEVILRLDPKACEAAQHELSFTFADYDPVNLTVPTQASAFALEYVGVSSHLDELHIYTRSQPQANVSLTRVEIDGRPVKADIHPVYNGLVYSKVKLTQPWKHCTFHAVAIGADTELRAVLMRALPTPAPLGVMGNNSDREIQEYANHLFGTNIAFTSVPAQRYATLAKYGLGGAYIYYSRLKPGEKKYEPIYYNDVDMLAPIKEQDALWAYFLEDEPDGRYHRTVLPRRAISRDVERANQFCRIFDPNTPTYLQMNHGGYPRNLYIYGQIPDYICTHSYPFGRDIIGNTKDHVTHLQAASRPRPFYYLNDGYCRNEKRELEPDEMRMEVYTALACGAKSLQWYPAHSANGLLKHPKMWNAVGEMNGILRQTLPFIAIGQPIGEPQIESGNYLSSCILCGDKAIIVILVNKDYVSTPEEFVRAQTPPTTVRVKLPPFMKAVGVVRMRFPGGLPDIPAKITSSSVELTASANPVEMLLIYSDEDVFEELRQEHAKCLKRFVPMPEQ